MNRVKTKAAKKQIADKGIVDMFNQMLGTENANPSTVLPKYKLIASKVSAFTKVMGSTTDTLRKMFPEQKEELDDINIFAVKLTEIKFINVPEPDDRTEVLDAEISAHYTVLKGDNHIRRLILMYNNLIPYRDFLSAEIIDDTFVARIPGLSFNPFPFSNLNVKELFASKSIQPHMKKYILTVLKICMSICKEVYKTLTSADVDVKEFSEAIVASISQVKKLIPRCEKAFAKIEESVELLETNFDGYYKDFIQSHNPSTIMESFVIDVSNTGSADVQTTAQFRKIIMFYRKATAGKIKDPKISKVFDMLNENFKAMDGKSLSDEPDDMAESTDLAEIQHAEEKELSEEQVECGPSARKIKKRLKAKAKKAGIISDTLTVHPKEGAHADQEECLEHPVNPISDKPDPGQI